MTEPTRTPYCTKIRYGVTGAPEIPIDVSTAPDVTLSPTLVEIRYLAPRGSQPAFIDATVTGYWMRDGERWQPEKELLHHFKNGPEGWPAWLAEEARLHDPDAAAVPPPADRTVWVDGDPLLEALANAVWERCETGDGGIVHDDPRNIAVAAAAVLTAPVDRADDSARLHDQILTLQAELAKLRDLLRSENQRANAAIDREETAEQAAIEAQQDRAAVLREAADALDARAEAAADVFDNPAIFVAKGRAHTARVWREAARELRRLAADATPQHAVRPRRGDQFETWLKEQRDLCEGHASTWGAMDGLLDQYRLHADTGTPLGDHVCEGKTAGDCDCLEPGPASVVALQPDTTQDEACTNCRGSGIDPRYNGEFDCTDCAPVRHAPGIAVLCPACRAKGHAVCVADEAPKPVGYSGKGRVFCTACPRPDGEDVPLTADEVDHWELCPSCGRHVIDVASADEGA